MRLVKFVIAVSLALAVTSCAGSAPAVPTATKSAAPIVAIAQSSAPTPITVVLPSPTVILAPTTAPTKAPIPTAAPTPALPQVYKVGDEVAVGGHKIKLVSVKSGLVIYAEVLTTNNDGASVFEQYYGCFYAQDESWGQLNAIYPEGYAGWYQGDIRSGDKLKGAVAFTTGTTGKHPRLYYNGCDGQQNASPVVFALTPDDDGKPWPIPDLSRAVPDANQKYGVSDMVTLDKFFVQLVAAKKTGNEVSATVFVYNASAKPFHVSHMNSFEAKDADGNQAGYDIRGGSAQAYDELDGFVAPNQGLLGTLVYKFTSPPVGDVVLTYKTDTYPQKFVAFVIR